MGFIHQHGSVNTVARTGQLFSHDDARFIAESRTLVPALADALQAALAKAATWRENYDRARQHAEDHYSVQVSVYENRIAALEAALPKWISVSERLPEFPEGVTAVNVLVFGRWGVREASWVDPIYNVRNKHPRLERDGRLLHFEPTLWMPMPEGPKVSA